MNFKFVSFDNSLPIDVFPLPIGPIRTILLLTKDNFFTILMYYNSINYKDKAVSIV